ncbi:hypothetical protein [Streptomyces sp. NBC_00046]|uniref:hypothetical protein n=1 Tax=unclassified Streptomyces TaxID=2593676 RepID=UPI00324AB722
MIRGRLRRLLIPLWAFAPFPVLAVSLVPVQLLTTVWSVPDGRLGSSLGDLSAFLFCWLLGFAYRESVLAPQAPGRSPTSGRIPQARSSNASLHI